LRDMVRESIFNIIKHSSLLSLKLEQCVVLDLFSGIGSFGLEALSRGVKKVIFFENYLPAIKMLKKNITNLSFTNKSQIINEDIKNKNLFKHSEEKFDIVFLDPPFKENNITYILDNLLKSEVLHSKTIIILHRHKKTLDDFSKKFVIIREEIYGSSKIIFGRFIF